MTRDKQILYSVTLLNVALLLSALFIRVESSRILAAGLIVPLALLTFFAIRKRKSDSIQKREVLLLTAIIGVLYAILIQLSGSVFGIYKNPYFVNSKLLLTEVLPLIVLIVGSEVIRYVLVSQKNTLVTIVAFISCVIAETLTCSGFVGITGVNSFMDLVGQTLLPAISANVFYHYVSSRYGMLPNIVFRLITSLYIYFIPVSAKMPEALLAFAKLFLPLLMLALVSAMFEKKKKNARHREGGKISSALCVIAILFVLGVAMLISCQFRYGALVIATESMTGEINKGDMIIYEEYGDQIIEEGQVIVFLQSGRKIVHRVVRIENTGNELRYYTKGDANPTLDMGYRLDADIVGLTDVKVAYVGYPTLWLRDIMKNK